MLSFRMILSNPTGNSDEGHSNNSSLLAAERRNVYRNVAEKKCFAPAGAKSVFCRHNISLLRSLVADLGSGSINIWSRWDHRPKTRIEMFPEPWNQTKTYKHLANLCNFYSPLPTFSEVRSDDVQRRSKCKRHNRQHGIEATVCDVKRTVNNE